MKRKTGKWGADFLEMPSLLFLKKNYSSDSNINHIQLHLF